MDWVSLGFRIGQKGVYIRRVRDMCCDVETEIEILVVLVVMVIVV